MAKILLILAAAFGFMQCKTSKVRGPNGSNPGQGLAGGAGAKLDINQLLLTETDQREKVANAANLKISSIEVDTSIRVGSQTRMFVSVDSDVSSPDNIADYASIRVCKDGACFAQAYTSFWKSEEILIPSKSSIVGKVDVYVRACALSYRIEDYKKVNCGSEERKRATIAAANANDSTAALMRDRSAAISKMKDLSKSLEAPSRQYINWLNAKSSSATEQEKTLYAAAANIVSNPILMGEIISSTIIDELADQSGSFTQQSESLNLTATEQHSGEVAEGIDDAITCGAAGHVWENSDRTCYKKEGSGGLSDHVNIRVDRDWAKGTTTAGIFLIAGAVGIPLYMAYDAEFVKKSKVVGQADGSVKVNAGSHPGAKATSFAQADFSGKSMTSRVLSTAQDNLKGGWGIAAGLAFGLGVALMIDGLSLSADAMQTYVDTLKEAEESLKVEKLKIEDINSKLANIN